MTTHGVVMTDHARSGTPAARGLADSTDVQASATRPTVVDAPSPSTTGEQRLMVVRHRELAVRSVHRAHGRAVWP